MKRETCILPLAGAQNTVWLDQQLEPESAAYNFSYHVALTGDVDGPRLQRAIERAVIENEAFRLCLIETPQGVRQKIMPCRAVALERCDLSHTPDPWRAAREAMAALALQPFDLEGGPVYRFSLFSLGPRESVWFVACHHIAVDGYGHQVFLQQVDDTFL